MRKSQDVIHLCWPMRGGNTSCHKPEDLEPWNLFSRFWRLKVWSQGVGGHALSEGHQGEAVLVLSAVVEVAGVSCPSSAVCLHQYIAFSYDSLSSLSAWLDLESPMCLAESVPRGVPLRKEDPPSHGTILWAGVLELCVSTHYAASSHSRCHAFPALVTHIFSWTDQEILPSSWFCQGFGHDKKKGPCSHPLRLHLVSPLR